jgi:Methyltransferase domain
MSEAALRSPTTGASLARDSGHSLSDGVGRWPVIDGIPYLRAGRESLVAEVLALLDRGQRDAALALLLADQDDWWDGPAPEPEAVADLIRRRDALTLREAMQLLSYGRVGDYFAHRWSDPTYLAGLALIEAHWTWPRTAFELACGIGHYLRELDRHGVTATGADVVYSKLWLARHFVVPARTRLVCFDAAHPWPLTEDAFDLVLCQDAFYFLEPKPAILSALRRAAGAGVLLVGHIHNGARDNASAGRGVTASALAELFHDALAYDDAELTRALIEARAPKPARPANLGGADAFAVAVGPGLGAQPRIVRDGVAMPPAGTRLRRNPLYAAGEGEAVIAWPSDRYRDEYAALATYPERSRAPTHAVAGPATEAATRRRELVDLPERW